MVTAVADQMAFEAAQRREMLVAAFMAETGLPLRRVDLVLHTQPGIAACWVKERESGGSWWRSFTRALRDPLGRRRKALVTEFGAFGLKASETALFVESGQTLRVYFAERRSLQVRCRACGKRVALLDFDNHAARHASA